MKEKEEVGGPNHPIRVFSLKTGLVGAESNCTLTSLELKGTANNSFVGLDMAPSIRRRQKQLHFTLKSINGYIIISPLFVINILDVYKSGNQFHLSSVTKTSLT
ncbi:hypothetical protein TNCV_1782531 [Trichonephila clavipes]|nr:hypothetical protein TNCV_1782531 [Trichonephila clavipes]